MIASIRASLYVLGLSFLAFPVASMSGYFANSCATILTWNAM